MEQNLPGSGKYRKKCKGCRKEFLSDARNTRYGPPELCKCAERRVKHRAKRAKERREYHRDPETHKALSRTRAEARKLVLSHFGVTVKGKRVLLDGSFDGSIGCNSTHCHHNFQYHLEREMVDRAGRNLGERGAKQAAVKRLLRNLEAHHRDHNPFNNCVENYPTGSNVELLCRKHHEQADRAKAGKAELVPYEPPMSGNFLIFLVELRIREPRTFFKVPINELHDWFLAAN